MSLSQPAMPEHVLIPMETLVTGNSTGISRGTGGHDTQRRNDGADPESRMLGKTPTPIYRHAAPSGPWPWMDFDEDILTVTPADPPTDSDAQSWHGYPQSLFPNWTKCQVERCKMLKDCPEGESNVFKVDVLHDGTFDEACLKVATVRDGPSVTAFWELLNRKRDENIRVRALFVKNTTKEVLQMLGQRYGIEPFFFSSSTNWIPSRYQENVVPKQSDHITVVLPFIRLIDRKAAGPIPQHLKPDFLRLSKEDDQIIDTQSPLYLDTCDKYILQDLLSIHMVRTVESSTIISYHPEMRSTTAEQLHSLINRTGRSVYWSKNFDRSKDPTCLFLCFLWYAMYEWDEVLEVLYSHINQLEQVVHLGSEKIRATQHWHILQAHLLYFRNLLEDFRKSVLFVKETENPAMQNPSVTVGDRDEAKRILEKETEYLISEIERLESQRMMQVMRLKNVMDLAFASVNIEDNQAMKDLTLATVRDSAAMKQIAYLTTVFLPANFMSNVFSMNVTEINPQGGETLTRYIAGAIGLTVFAVWVTIALQVNSIFFPLECPLWRRLGWPVFYPLDQLVRVYRRVLGRKHKTR